jgi:uncharacterized protein DUF4383
MRDRSQAQQLTMLLGIVFLLVGILGFIPGITTNYDDMSFAGDDSGAELLGIFQVSILHNLVHALFGIAGLALARSMDGAKQYLFGGGVIYLGLWILGLANGGDWIPVNSADNWLHLVLGVSLIGLGVVTTRETMTRMAPQA